MFYAQMVHGSDEFYTEFGRDLVGSGMFFALNGPLFASIALDVRNRFGVRWTQDHATRCCL
jgi:hypothetical protein